MLSKIKIVNQKSLIKNQNLTFAPQTVLSLRFGVEESPDTTE